MSSQRLILGIGFAVLAVMSAASIGLDVKSRSDAIWVNHTLEVSKSLTAMRLLFRRAESAARGYLLSGDPHFIREYRETFDQIAPAFAELGATLKQNTDQSQLLASSELLVTSRFAITKEFIDLHTAGDSAGIAALTARAEGRALMESVEAKFDQLAREEQRLLAIRSAESKRTGSLLLAIDLSCTGLILILAAILIREGRRSSRKQATMQRATEAANETLESRHRRADRQLAGRTREAAALHIGAQQHVCRHGRGGAGRRHHGRDCSVELRGRTAAALSPRHADRSTAGTERHVQARWVNPVGP
jgi:CHASE3 domain sensor protein